MDIPAPRDPRYNLRMNIRHARYITLLVCTAAVGCGLGAFDNSAPLTITDNFHAIVEGVAYRSAQLDATSLDLVFEQYGVRTIINLRGENDNEPWYANERTAAEQAGVKLVDIRMSANSLPSRETLLKLFDTFQTAEYPILIHCQSGADRTGAAAAIWRMQVRGDTREAAADELSPAYGHFAGVHPTMDKLIRIFQPDRAWIEDEYPG
jgi:protein tyrosine/serine phosphatase